MATAAADWWALQDDPADGEMAFDERHLEQGGEAKILCVACIRALLKRGEPFVSRGACLRQHVGEKLLDHATDLLVVCVDAKDGGVKPPRWACYFFAAVR